MHNHTTEACGKRKRVLSGNGNSDGSDSAVGDNAGGSEKACYIGGSQAIPDPIAFTTNERRKHETQFAQAQHVDTRR